MALKGCYGCLKWLVFLVNLIFWLAGVAVLGLSIWLLVDVALYAQITSDPVSFSVGTYILLGVGACMTVIGFLGCCGAIRESQCLLATFFIFLMVVLVAQIIAAVWAYQNQDKLEQTIRKSVRDTVSKDYLPNPSPQNEAFDAIQQGLKCCGSDGPQSWAQSAYNGFKSELGIGAVIGNVAYQLPPSCCVEPKSTTCENTRKLGVGATAVSLANTVIYRQGCTDAFVKVVKDYADIVFIVVIVIGVIEVLGMICSMLLCCAIRKIDDFKA